MVECRDLPLFAWGAALRAARTRRTRLRRRAAVLGAGIVCLGLTIALPPLPRLVWNASGSAPIGLYAVSPGAALRRGDMVIAWPPSDARQLAARRRYLPSNVPLVKRVAAIAGDSICGVGNGVTVNGKPLAKRRAADAAGRPLPAWQGCIRLERGMVFLLLRETPDSFDGRYFGPTLAPGCDRQGDAAVGPLKPLALAVAFLVATPAAADPPRTDAVLRWRAEIAEASTRFGVPVAWIERVVRAESGGQTMLDGRPITSRAGAMGLMQLMPAIWAAMREAHGLGANPQDPRDNILAGTAYLRAMYDRFGYPGLFAAYNAGPGRYAAHLATGRPLPAETRAYLAQVSGRHSGSLPSLLQRSPVLFVVLRTGDTSADPSPLHASEEASDTLFAVRAPR